ncbi:unnamed protein product [Symbiodinium sp. CCMP2592]|nr:unnamed protein product [Symbiodinium sp. CCMP2592]
MREVDERCGVASVGAVPWVYNYNLLITASGLTQEELMTRCRRMARSLSARGGGLAAVETMALPHESGVEANEGNAHMAEEFVTGFEKRLAFQLHDIKQNRGWSGEGIWITKSGSSFTSLDGGHRFNIGLEDTLSHFTVEEFAAGYKKTMAFRAARHQAENRLVRRGHLDYQIWQLKHFTDMVAFTDVEGRRCSLEHRFEDTLAYVTVDDLSATRACVSSKPICSMHAVQGGHVDSP